MERIPQTIDDYVEWSQKEFGGGAFGGDGIELRYLVNIASALNAVQSCQFVAGLADCFEKAAVSYREKFGVDLFLSSPPPNPQWHTKPYRSALDKSYRANIVENTNFPQPPDGGWVDAKSLLARINDPIRTTVVCRYLDAPSWLSKSLESLGRVWFG